MKTITRRIRLPIMSYLFICPHCQTKTRVEQRYSGLVGECVTCGGAIKVPRFASDREQTSVLRGARRPLIWVIASLVAVVLVGCFVVALVRLGGDSMNRLAVGRERTSSIRNLEKIAAALNAYAADHGSYPTPASRDENGGKLHSWRVLILPYLGEDELYNQLNLKAAWDDPQNMAAANDIPAVFRHPNASKNGMYAESGYYLVVGKGTLFPSSGALGPDQIVDDPAQTILLVEGVPIVPSGVWTEPIDLDYSRMSGRIGGNPGFDPGGLLEGGSAVATTDGRGHFLSDTIDPMVFRSLVTPRGGERLADDTLD